MQNMLIRWVCIVCFGFVASACGDDDRANPIAPEKPEKPNKDAGADSGAGAGGSAGAAGSTAGAGGRRANSPLNCPARSSMPVTCGGETCPNEYPLEENPCFQACCVMFEGRERCGLRGTSMAFRTECVMPAVPDESCDEVPQFQGCCDLTQHRCGIIGGFAPGCQTKSSFVTLPKEPKVCGTTDDAGVNDAG